MRSAILYTACISMCMLHVTSIAVNRVGYNLDSEAKIVVIVLDYSF